MRIGGSATGAGGECVASGGEEVGTVMVDFGRRWYVWRMGGRKGELGIGSVEVGGFGAVDGSIDGLEDGVVEGGEGGMGSKDRSIAKGIGQVERIGPGEGKDIVGLVTYGQMFSKNLTSLLVKFFLVDKL